MKLLYVLVIASLAMNSYGQKIYHCEYREKVSFPMPDSFSQSMRKQIIDQGFSSKMADQVVQQVTSEGYSGTFVKIVEARADSTFILATNKIAQEEGSNMKMNMADAKFVYSKGKVYAYDTLMEQWLLSETWSELRTFEVTDDKKIIAGHSCTSYISTDTAMKIWIAEDLPDYVNPGLSIGRVKGAVLGYEWKNKDNNYTLRSELTKLE